VLGISEHIYQETYVKFTSFSRRRAMSVLQNDHSNSRLQVKHCPAKFRHQEVMSGISTCRPFSNHSWPSFLWRVNNASSFVSR